MLKEKHNAQRLAAVDRIDRERKAQAKISEVSKICALNNVS